MMKKLFWVFMLCLLSVPAAFAQDDGGKQSVYDRVMASGTLRCGYTLYSIGLNKNLETGELWGIYKDIVEEIGRNLDLKIVWAEEVGWGQQIEGLKTGRYDMICSPASVNFARTKVADYSKPLYYSPVAIWARKDDTRFDKNWEAINHKDIKISTMDGEQTDIMAQKYFPDAQRFSIPQSSEFSQLMLNVVTGKADVTFAEPLSVHEFMETNPDTLHNVSPDRALTLVPNILLIDRGQEEFKALINNSLTSLFLDGFIDRAINKYEKYPNSYVRSKGYY